MPNLWTKSIQSISEKLNGPRTNDVEIKNKYQETVKIENAFKKFREIIANFSNCLEGILFYILLESTLLKFWINYLNLIDY